MGEARKFDFSGTQGLTARQGGGETHLVPALAHLHPVLKQKSEVQFPGSIQDLLFLLEEGREAVRA